MNTGNISEYLKFFKEELDSVERDSVAVVPLGTPFLADSGATSTVILYASTIHRGAVLDNENYLGWEDQRRQEIW